MRIFGTAHQMSVLWRGVRMHACRSVCEMIHGNNMLPKGRTDQCLSLFHSSFAQTPSHDIDYSSHPALFITRATDGVTTRQSTRRALNQSCIKHVIIPAVSLHSLCQERHCSPFNLSTMFLHLLSGPSLCIGAAPSLYIPPLDP